jgi:hypothetical protein
MMAALGASALAGTPSAWATTAAGTAARGRQMMGAGQQSANQVRERHDGKQHQDISIHGSPKNAAHHLMIG